MATKEEILDAISNMTVLELKELLDRDHRGHRPSQPVVERWLAWIDQYGGVQAAEVALRDNLNAARTKSKVAFPAQGAEVVETLCARLEEVDG